MTYLTKLHQIHRLCNLTKETMVSWNSQNSRRRWDQRNIILWFI